MARLKRGQGWTDGGQKRNRESVRRGFLTSSTHILILFQTGRQAESF